MKIVIDLPEPLLRRVRGEIDNRDYETPQEFVRVAVENQLELGSSLESEEAPPSIDQYIANTTSDGEESQKSSLRDFSALDSQDIKVCSEPATEDITSGPLWGQYNRIFPVKLIVRVLANELATNGGAGVPLEDFQERVSSRARSIGMEIREADRQKSRSRGEKFSAGLPVGDDEEKSIDRFVSHFVGRRDGNGNLKGAAGQLGFVDIFGDGPQKIGLTERGLEFAMLENPLLDESPDLSTSLSEKERQFYLEHVSEVRPGEFDAISSVASMISKGTDRPEELTSEMAELNSDWTQAQANTMRTGLLSRMFELGLVNRTRVGQRGIAYELTSEGDEVIGNG